MAKSVYELGQTNMCGTLPVSSSAENSSPYLLQFRSQSTDSLRWTGIYANFSIHVVRSPVPILIILTFGEQYRSYKERGSNAFVILLL